MKNIKILVVGVHLRGGVEWRNDDLIEYEQTYMQK